MKLLTTRLALLPAVLFSAALALASPLPRADAAPLESFTAVVTRVSDGDTLIVERGGKPIKVRLRYVDAPELAHSRRQTDQPFGMEAARFAETWQGRTVTIVPQQRDRYGRVVAQVRHCADGVCIDLGATLVHHGLAWVDERYHPSKTLLSQQAAAKKEKRGLWRDDAPVPPSEWRKRVREESRKKMP